MEARVKHLLLELASQPWKKRIQENNKEGCPTLLLKKMMRAGRGRGKEAERGLIGAISFSTQAQYGFAKKILDYTLSVKLGQHPQLVALS